MCEYNVCPRIGHADVEWQKSTYWKGTSCLGTHLVSGSLCDRARDHRSKCVHDYWFCLDWEKLFFLEAWYSCGFVRRWVCSAFLSFEKDETSYGICRRFASVTRSFSTYGKVVCRAGFGFQWFGSAYNIFDGWWRCIRWCNHERLHWENIPNSHHICWDCVIQFEGEYMGQKSRNEQSVENVHSRQWLL